MVGAAERPVPAILRRSTGVHERINIMTARQTAGRGAPATVKRIGPDPEEDQVVAAPGELDLNEIIQQRAEALGIEDGERFSFVFNGHRFHMPHPLFASDEWNEDLADLETNEEVGIHFLGEDEYRLYRELGGKASQLSMVMQQVAKKATEIDDEGKPTPLSRSSRRAQRRRR
jgi:hypothetical protein